jgi:zinc D-Ala-D-Ala carboxypeptidase
MNSLMRRAIAGATGLATAAGLATFVAAAPAGAATSPPAAVRSHDFSALLPWPFVRPGSQGERVFAIQYLLQAKGLNVRADGIYGPRTTAAVRQFQRRNHLNPSGNVGPSTWSRITVTLRRGNRGSAVRALQHNLKFAYGFRFMRVDGFYGNETVAAVRAFQRGSRLSVNGVAGPRTWRTIIFFER